MKLHRRIWFADTLLLKVDRVVSAGELGEDDERSPPRIFSGGLKGSKSWRSSGIAWTALGAKLNREMSSGEVSSGRGRRRCGV
ncbi:hypothetical protein U1Q18_037273 [Sarracenia purpurea var. burkii]